MSLVSSSDSVVGDSTFWMNSNDGDPETFKPPGMVSSVVPRSSCPTLTKTSGGEKKRHGSATYMARPTLPGDPTSSVISKTLSPLRKPISIYAGDMAALVVDRNLSLLPPDRSCHERCSFRGASQYMLAAVTQGLLHLIAFRGFG